MLPGPRPRAQSEDMRGRCHSMVRHVPGPDPPAAPSTALPGMGDGWKRLHRCKKGLRADPRAADWLCPAVQPVARDGAEQRLEQALEQGLAQPRQPPMTEQGMGQRCSSLTPWSAHGLEQLKYQAGEPGSFGQERLIPAEPHGIGCCVLQGSGKGN